MLDTECDEVVRLLSERRPKETCFFAFANTVSTLNFKKDNNSHGWLGVRFQLKPSSPANEVILHVKLLENDTAMKMGSTSVNLNSLELVSRMV